MKYENRIVCFIDILGFRAIIGRTKDKNGNDVEKEVSNVADVLNCIRETLSIDEQNLSKSKIVTQFSDSIVISFDYTESSEIFHTLLDIQHVIINLIGRGVLCRGGISKGSVYHDDKLLFGPAMNNAYTLESKAANYPRVILSEDIVTLSRQYKSPNHSEDMEEGYVKSLLCRDSDGMYYIDFIASVQSELDDPECDYPIYLHKLADIIATGIDSSKPDIFVKYSWLKEKYIDVVSAIHERIDAPESLDEVSDYYSDLPLFE